MLIAWNAAINLTATRDPADVARRHVVDSLAGAQPMRDRGIRDFVDIGSGGGFPGLPLAVVLGSRHSLLVESVTKKAGFLGVAVEATGLRGRVAVAAQRAERLADDPAHRAAWPAVVARAVAGLADLIELALPLLAADGWLLAWKGRGLEDELPAARRAARTLGGGPIEVVDAAVAAGEHHRLAIVSKVEPTPVGFPREPAIRRRRPW